ncbi:hypothetical protein LXA43DRAFT_1009281 [Ganoderma leucocontextum]|nr:hypothetical protein LXA43DRAFT_1009281 [Ganoderma leucocontextum]
MHPTLCIDEVLQLIFDFSGDVSDPEPKWTYAQLARCCKTWTDPALDRLWRRMSGPKPLLALLPKSDEFTMAATPVVEAYAKRVRHIVYADGFLSVPSLKLSKEHGPNVFPNLESVALANAACLAPPAWTASPFLKRVTVNLSFSRKPHSVLDRGAAVARFLPTLRGRMSDALNTTLASLTQLCSLTVHTGESLGCEAFAAIATFPALRTLEVHASHINADELDDALAGASQGDTQYFPALEELSIRTNAALLAALLTRIPAGVLRKLSLDMVDGDGKGDGDRGGPEPCMKPIFELLAQKAAGSLLDLFIEDRTVHDEERDDTPGAPRQGYSLDVLGPLARVRQLRSFTLREPDLFDTDLETMARWWPALEHLDLGTFEGSTLEESEEEQVEAHGVELEVTQAKSQMTSGVYGIVARSFRFLESLTLSAPPPREVATGEESARFVTELWSLTAGKASDATGKVDAPAVVDALLSIFPTVKSMDCPDAEVSARFETVVAGRR